MSTKRIWILILFLILPFVYCKKNPVEKNDNITPGRRDYIWDVDTLEFEFYYLSSLWGSNPEDVWAVASGTWTHTIWHYDGITWQRYHTPIAGSLISVYGFSSNDVWACGHNAIYHFDGITWQKFISFSLEGYEYTYLNNIWGNTPNNIYAVGAVWHPDSTKAIMVQFDGNNWEFVNIPNTRASFAWVRQGTKEENNFYFTATKFAYPETVAVDTNKLYVYDWQNMKEIYSGITVATVNEMAGRIYLVIGKKIYKYHNNTLLLWKDFSDTQYGGRVWGRSENDFFASSSSGLLHYNGIDLITIYPTDCFINAIFVMEKDVYMICEGRIIVHGSLN